MKLTRRLKTKNLPRIIHGFTRLRWIYPPPGYYKRRPHIKNPYLNMEIGHIESFQCVVVMSPTATWYFPSEDIPHGT